MPNGRSASQFETDTTPASPDTLSSTTPTPENPDLLGDAPGAAAEVNSGLESDSSPETANSPETTYEEYEKRLGELLAAVRGLVNERGQRIDDAMERDRPLNDQINMRVNELKEELKKIKGGLESNPQPDASDPNFDRVFETRSSLSRMAGEIHRNLAYYDAKQERNDQRLAGWANDPQTEKAVDESTPPEDSADGQADRWWNGIPEAVDRDGKAGQEADEPLAA